MRNTLPGTYLTASTGDERISPLLGDVPDFTEKGICLKESFTITEPNEVKGFIQLRHRYWDIINMLMVW